MKSTKKTMRQINIARELESFDEWLMRKDGHRFGIGERVAIISRLENSGYRIVRKTKKPCSRNL